MPLKFKPPVSVRASTGMVAYLWAALNIGDAKTKIILDGIGDGIEAYYPNAYNTKVGKYAFNQVHKIDLMIYEKYRSQT